MDSAISGSFRLFRLFGIDVYLHWSWFLVAAFLISMPRSRDMDYHLPAIRVLEYVCLFALVLMHEFGHVLACRSVGGRAERIVLWPLGGVAYVAPPPRPGPVLWSIAAGPLVNFILALPSSALWIYATAADWELLHHDVFIFVKVLALMNIGLFVFNMLPIYPLDGGQILQALLWFSLGRWRSLEVVGFLGMFFGGVIFLLSAVLGLWWGVIIAAYVILRAYVGWQQARGVQSLLALPRRDDCVCPRCEISPPRGAFWVCEHCHTRFDLFETHGQCPACGAWYLHPDCPHCRNRSHIDQWFGAGKKDEVTAGQSAESG